MNMGRRVWLVLLTGVLVAAMLAYQSSAYARPQVQAFNIPSQDLASALKAYATISSEQVAFDASKCVGKRSRALIGIYNADQGLDLLLSGTGMKVVILTSGVRGILPAPAVIPSQAIAAPSSAGPPTVPAETILLVTGIRNSLQSAVANKRAAGGFNDSIVAEDIGKLPDSNLAEAMQRVPGVQITRNMGEGDGIAIRG